MRRGKKQLYIEQLRDIELNVNHLIRKECQKIVVTSPKANEGKSTFCQQYGELAVRGMKKVLLIDCDFYKKGLSTYFLLDKSYGFVNVLEDGTDYLDHCYSGLDNQKYELKVMPVGLGPLGVNYEEKVQKILAIAENQFDLVMIDSAPLSAKIDAKKMAQYCDGVILVVDGNTTKRNTVVDIDNQLTLSGNKLLGVVLNKNKQKSKYYQYHTYY